MIKDLSDSTGSLAGCPSITTVRMNYAKTLVVEPAELTTLQTRQLVLSKYFSVQSINGFKFAGKHNHLLFPTDTMRAPHPRSALQVTHIFEIKRLFRNEATRQRPCVTSGISTSNFNGSLRTNNVDFSSNACPNFLCRIEKEVCRVSH
mmetsp:Transcript_11795/g.34629  ORF Transcript_11795/g.34629 Transcript_11795/m.34629 type:complete len:148 (-) Transcript_11795:110-553(-)